MSDTNGTQTSDQPIFSVEKLYVRDLSIEVPNAPQCFLERETPNIDVQLATAATRLDEGFFDVTLTVTVTAKIGQDKTLFLIEAAQAGIFQIRNVPEENLEPLLFAACPNLLYPYAREAITSSSLRAGFQPVILAPVNFEALYAQQKRQAELAQSGEGEARLQ